MRGSDDQNGSLFSYVNVDERIPARHPLRKIRDVVNSALTSLDADFDRLYASEGRPSVAPERLLRASLIQILFSVRSERQLMEQLQYNLLFRWFVGLGIDDPVWVPTVFSKNRDRLLNTDIARKFLAAILAHDKVAPLLSDDAQTEDTSMKPTDTTNQRIGRNIERDWRGHVWSNATHASVTDPDARLMRKGKGKPAQLCYMGHALMENRHGFIVETELTRADGYAERAAALTMIERHSPGSERRLTLGADKGYDEHGFVATLRKMCVSPHIAAKAKGSAIDRRTTRHAGYALSQRKRKQVEEPFGWGKTVGQIAKTMLRGVANVGAQFTLNMAAFNLAKLPRLLAD